MKNKFKWVGIAVISAIMVFGFLGCAEPEPEKPKGGNAALLTKITIGGAGDMVGSVTPATAVSSDDYTQGTSMADVAGAIVLKNTAALKGEIKLTISAGAEAKIVRAANANAPALSPNNAYDANAAIENGDAFTNLANNNYIFIRVVSKDESKTNYYAYKINVQGGSADLSTLKIGTVDVVNKGSPAITIDGATKGSIALSKAAKDGALVATSTEDVGISYAIVRKNGTAPNPDSGFTAAAPSPWEFQDEDTIYIKLISQNKELTQYYVIGVEMGRDASLASVSINNIVLEGEGLGTSAATAPAADDKFTIVEVGQQNPVNGSPIVITPNDSGATATWGVGTIAGAVVSEPATYGTDQTITFVDGAYFFVKVTPENGPALYYGFKVHLGASGMIYYGRPNVKDPAGIDSKYIDPLWTDPTFGADDLPIYDISRINTAESSALPTYRFTNTEIPGRNHTRAWAKAMWDDEGLYIYAEVEFTDYYDSSADKAINKLTPRVLQRDSGSIDAQYSHKSDSFEIFTNERYQAYKAGNYGSQWRVNPSVSGGVENIFGTPDEVVASLRNSGDYNTWVTTDTNGKQTGYVVLAKVPWWYIGNNDANDVFGTDGLVRTVGVDDGPTIGMELQINACTWSNTNHSVESRDAVLTWNGVATASYNQCEGYGVAKLVMGAGRNRVIAAKKPVISTHPANTNYLLGDLGADQTSSATALSVTASAATPPAPALSYQWYYTTTEGGTGTPIAGATSATYKPTTLEVTAVGTYYYWVEVTNTRTGATTGYETATTTSNRATVSVDLVQKPNITTHPASGTFFANATIANRTVAITTIPAGSGTVTYEWYSSTVDADDAGAPVVTQPNANSLPIATSATASTTWYWVVVTNTGTAGSSSVTSNKAVVQILEELVITKFPTTNPLGYNCTINGNTLTFGTGTYQRGGWNIAALTAPDLGNGTVATVTLNTNVVGSVEITYTSEGPTRFFARNASGSGNATAGILPAGENPLVTAATTNTVTLPVSKPATAINIQSIFFESNPDPTTITIESIKFKPVIPTPPEPEPAP